MKNWIDNVRQKLLDWLGQGITQRQLAWTLALGFVIGCLPIFGVTTGCCLLISLCFRLNLPVIQAANYAALPAQLLLLVPFIRMGEWLFGQRRSGMKAEDAVAIIHATNLRQLLVAGGEVSLVVGHALGAWMIVAAPAMVLLSLVFRLLLRQIPALSNGK